MYDFDSITKQAVKATQLATQLQPTSLASYVCPLTAAEAVGGTRYDCNRIHYRAINTNKYPYAKLTWAFVWKNAVVEAIIISADK